MKTNAPRTAREYIFFVSCFYVSEMKQRESDGAVTGVGEMKSVGIIGRDNFKGLGEDRSKVLRTYPK